ncbi:hypothetical protein D5086_028012 [Populus alba]|uniref:Uncharacterized protein n=1 Tax=Populus alba TaxID=43335 RepID=A0ACC4AX59_POPAL
MSSSLEAGVNQLAGKGHKGVLGVKRWSSEMMERRDGVQEPCIRSSPEGGKGEVERRHLPTFGCSYNFG